MFNEVLKLVSQTKTEDEYGNLITSGTVEREVFADLKSIGQQEFYQAHATGLAPEIKFIIADYVDYQNEKIIKYQAFNESEEEEYSVIRTFRNGNSLEITCKRGIDE